MPVVYGKGKEMQRRCCGRLGKGLQNGGYSQLGHIWTDIDLIAVLAHVTECREE